MPYPDGRSSRLIVLHRRASRPRNTRDGAHAARGQPQVVTSPAPTTSVARVWSPLSLVSYALARFDPEVARFRKVTAPDEAELDLSAAADALGVHYQTAYRWVRSGRLRARLVDGRYLVTRDDIDRADARRRVPKRPAPPGRRRIEHQAEHVHAALLVGDEPVVRSIARRLVDDGTKMVELIEEVLAPPLRMIGQAWHDGQLSVWVEHRASAIVERTLGELSPNPRGRRRGTAVVAAVSGDRHGLPTTMATVVLREANWHVHHLGADMPACEIVHFCSEHPVDLAVLTVTNPDSASVADDTAKKLRRSGTPTIVGGPGRRLEDLVAEAADSLIRRA